MYDEKTLTATLRAADVVIGYTPLSDEVSFASFLKEKKILGRGLSVIADRDISPFDFAKSLRTVYVAKKVCIFVPGRIFDRFGTRHGRGGGWYDRFLSEVPPEWIRIGVLNAIQLSEQALERQSWDQPVNYLLIADNSLWSVISVKK